MSQGCNGGYPLEAWQYFVKTGTVTGNDYESTNTGKSCFPYQLPNCDHHEGGPYPSCPTICGASECATPKCTKTCEANYPTDWAADKHHASSAYSVSSNVAQIQAELMTYGSVTAAFTVYADFPTYTSGVYSHVSGAELGGHAVKIVGWGTTAGGVDYWVVAVRFLWHLSGRHARARVLPRNTAVCIIPLTLSRPPSYTRNRIHGTSTGALTASSGSSAARMSAASRTRSLLATSRRKSP